MQRQIFVIFLIALSSHLRAEAFSFDVASFLYDRQEIKQSERWDLYSALFGSPRGQIKAQRFGYNKNTWWLENNFYLAQGNFDTAKYEILPAIGTNSGSSRRFGFSSFLFFVGLQYNETDFGNYRVNLTNLSLRIYGSSQQSTRLNLILGQKNFSGPGFIEQYTFAPTVGLEGCVYLFNQIGITVTNYQFSKNQGLTGDRLDSELFVEYGAFRFFVQRFRERFTLPVASKNQIPAETAGMLTGASFFF